jgi:transcriptional regulator with XRE-family HTH domain
METERIRTKIRAERHKSGFTLGELAERLGIGLISHKRIETGKSSPSAALLSEIAHQLNRSIFSFFEQKGDPFVQIKLKSQRSISSHMLKIKLIGPRKSIADDIVVTYGELKKGKRINTHVNQGIEFSDNIEGKDMNYLLTTN